MIVDDDDIVLRVMCKAIDRAGIRYYATTNPLEALEQLDRSRFDVILTDLVMDEMDGIELFSRAKAEHTLLRGICSSGFLDYSKVTRVISAGFDDCLIKPVRSDDLVQSLRASFTLHDRWSALLERIAEGKTK